MKHRHYPAPGECDSNCDSCDSVSFPPDLNTRGTVVNLYHVPNEPYVLIGRKSLFGNPFTHLLLNKTNAAIQLDTRELAVEAYRTWLTTDSQVPGWTKPSHEQIADLRGRTLACFCAPRQCHGDVLLDLAELYCKTYT